MAVMSTALVNVLPALPPPQTPSVPATPGPVTPFPAFLMAAMPLSAADGASLDFAPPADQDGTALPPDGNLMPLASPWLPPAVAPAVGPLVASPPSAQRPATLPPAVAAGAQQGSPLPPLSPAVAVSTETAAPSPAASTALPTPGANLPAPAAVPPPSPEAVPLPGSVTANEASPADDPVELSPLNMPRRVFATTVPAAAAAPAAGAGPMPAPPAAEAALEPARPALSGMLAGALESAQPEADPPGGTAVLTAAAPPAERAPASGSVMQLSKPVGSEAFRQELGERIVSMVDRDLGTAQLKLNPPQLGPIEVRVQVAGDQASVSLSAHNFQARDALEQALPRLREMLGGQGFTSVDVNVAQHSFQERPGRPDVYRPPAPDDGIAFADAPASPARAAVRSSRALLDAYA